MAARCTRSTFQHYRQALRPSAHSHPATRHFGASSPLQRSGGVSSLDSLPTSSPELIDLMSLIRKRIFLPAHLKPGQRALVFKKSKWPILRREPIDVEVAGESFRLEPIDRTTHVPDSWKSLVKVLNLMTPSDQVRNSNEQIKEFASAFARTFVELLREFYIAGRRWTPWHMEFLARKAGMMGMASAVIRAARVGKETGMVFNDVRIVREALWGCREFWIQGGDIDQALRFAEQIAAICEEKDHQSKSLNSSQDPKSQPDCIAVLLELAAERATDAPDEKIRKDAVSAYAERLLWNLGSGPDYFAIEGKELERIEKRPDAVASYQLTRWIPAVRGLEKALVLLGDDMPMGEIAGAQLDILKQKIAENKSIIDSANNEKKRFLRGVSWLEGSPA